MQITHTPGPWVLIDADSETPHIVAEQGKKWNNPTVCTFYDDVTPEDSVTIGAWYEQHDNFKANARLIAAAPDLLAVLLELQESAQYWSEYDVPLGIVDRINAAIAKATGAA